MLSAENRLKSKKDIDFVFRSGRMITNDFLCLKYHPNKKDRTRVAFSLGLSYSKSAVERNRAKRIMREAVRLHIEKIRSGFDLVFFLRKGFTQKITLKETETMLGTIFKKANLFN
jgi:ribonuclease P protein component